MPTATAMAPVRREEHHSVTDDSRTRRRPAPETEPRLTYSVKEAIDALSDDVKALTKAINEDKQLTERRFSLLEQNALLTEQHARLLESIQKDFNGFEQRFKDHERNAFHQQGEPDIAGLKAIVQGLRDNQITQQAVKDLTDDLKKERKADRYWLVGMGVTLFIFVIRDAFPFFIRVAQAFPTPTPPMPGG